MIKYKFAAFIPAFILSLTLFPQQQGKVISHYLFPEFVKGTVLMKNGTKNPAMLNYNAASEEMVFDQNGKILAISNPTLNQLDTVYIQNRKFVRLNNKFVEVLRSGDFTLFAEYKCRVIPPGKPAAYGGTSQTSSTDTYSSWSVDGRIYSLQLPDDFTVKPYIVYGYRKDGKLKTFVSIGQIRKFYNKKKKQFKEYEIGHVIDFNSTADILELFEYLENI